MTNFQHKLLGGSFSRFTLISLVALAGPGIGVASAQDRGAQGDDSEIADAQGRSLLEIVVTAQKRESTIEREPIAVSVLSGDEIARAGGADPSVLSDLVPNFHVGEESNRDGVLLTIRGISAGDVRNGADPTTAFHVDGGYVPRLSGANAYFFDVERVEVLRGPQGTIYGRNSTAGVVNVITKRPEFDEVSGSLSTAVGNYDLFTVQGALNVPLGDTVAARVAFTRNKRDGYRENVFVKDGDDADDYAVRGHLLFEPSDRTSILLTGEYYKRKGVGNAAAFFDPLNTAPGSVSPDPAGINALDTQGFRDNSDLNFRIEATQDFDAFAITYQGAYRKHKRNFLNDADGSAIPAIQSFVREITQSETMTHELRVASTNASPFQYILGAYYLEEVIDGSFTFGLPRTFARGPLAGAGPQPFRLNFVDKDLTNDSLAFFAHTTYQLTDALGVTAGIRHTKDKKDQGGVATDLGGSAATATGSFQHIFIEGGRVLLFTPQISSPEFTKTTWKLGMDYQINDDHLLYASVSTGFKAGGFNRGSQAVPGGELVVFQPENITAFELGWKAKLFDGQLQLNTTAFHYIYDDLQVGQTFQRNGVQTNQTINAAAANVTGIEFEANALIGASGTLNASLGLLKAEYNDFVGVNDNTLSGLQSLDASGNKLPFAPEVTATISYVPIVLDLFGGTLEPRAQLHYSSALFLGPLNRQLDRQGSFTKTDLSLRYENGPKTWNAEVFVNNVTDEDVVIYQECTNFGEFGTPIAQCERNFAAPRTYGLRVGVNF